MDIKAVNQPHKQEQMLKGWWQVSNTAHLTLQGLFLVLVSFCFTSKFFLSLTHVAKALASPRHAWVQVVLCMMSVLDESEAVGAGDEEGACTPESA